MNWTRVAADKLISGDYRIERSALYRPLDDIHRYVYRAYAGTLFLGASGTKEGAVYLCEKHHHEDHEEMSHEQH